MKTLQQLGTNLGKLLEEKNAAYGSSFAASGDFLRLLFPRGVPADRYDDALLMVRIFDKQMRIATDKDAFGESPYQDIAGYGICGLQLHQQRKDSTKWPDIVSEDAATQSEAQPDSAAKPTEPKTTQNESATNEPAPSLQPANSSDQQKDASVSTVMGGVSASAADQLRQLRNRKRHCAYCGGGFYPFENSHVRSGGFIYCSMTCCDRDVTEALV